MDTPEGLVVPNIKHCEQRTLWEVAAELNRLQEASSNMKIDSEDLKDGTFTLSNVGMVNIFLFVQEICMKFQKTSSPFRRSPKAFIWFIDILILIAREVFLMINYLDSKD